MPLLLREAIGGTIRRARTERQRTLRDVSREARVSLGYLSEIERGRKEPSSELLAAICEALALPLPDLLVDVAASMRPARRPRPVAVATGPIDPALRSAVEEAFAPEPSVPAAPAVPPAPAEPTPASETPPTDVLDAHPGAPADDAPDPGATDDDPTVPTVRLVGLVTVGGPAGPAGTTVVRAA